MTLKKSNLIENYWLVIAIMVIMNLVGNGYELVTLMTTKYEHQMLVLNGHVKVITQI